MMMMMTMFQPLNVHVHEVHEVQQIQQTRVHEQKTSQNDRSDLFNLRAYIVALDRLGAL